MHVLLEKMSLTPRMLLLLQFCTTFRDWSEVLNATEKSMSTQLSSIRCMRVTLCNWASVRVNMFSFQQLVNEWSLVSQVCFCFGLDWKLTITSIKSLWKFLCPHADTSSSSGFFFYAQSSSRRLMFGWGKEAAAVERGSKTSSWRCWLGRSDCVSSLLHRDSEGNGR